jgi:hypothetical protein
LADHHRNPLRQVVS